jgi:hypothetical protein
MSTIRMVNAEGKSADVHPDMVEEYRRGGFEVADNPLDHDGNGRAGGSVAGFHATAAKGARKRKAKE